MIRFLLAFLTNSVLASMNNSAHIFRYLGVFMTGLREEITVNFRIVNK